MNALLLNRILMGSIAFLVILAGVVFYFSSQFLRNTALETDHARTDITLATSNIDTLKRLETEMANKKDIVNRANQIVSESGQYQYQDQIVKDVNTYAALAGVSISGFSFAAEASTTTPTVPGKVVVPGVRTLDATVTLNTPIQYDNFLRFLKAIEQNLTKMQITGVNMSPDKSNGNAISSPTIGLQIYVKG